MGYSGMTPDQICPFKTKLMIKRFITFISFLMSISSLTGQATKENGKILPDVSLGETVAVKFGGFVRIDYFYDTRKSTGAVEDLFSFFPLDHQYDSRGHDQNKIARNYLSAQSTRFNALFTGPELLKAKTSSFLEFDFTGGNTFNVRLRHAYIKLNWPKSELLIGKTWSPLTSTILPSVLGLHTGIPFQPFGRGDQVRFTYKAGKVKLLGAAFYQSEHRSFSYSNSLTSEVGQLTDNVISNPLPDLHFQLHYSSGSFFAGVVTEYKVIMPAVETKGTAGIFSTNETISSYAAGGFAEFKNKKLTVKGSSIYGQNLSELFQQGGYAVTSLDSLTGNRKFTPSNSISSWIDIIYGEKILFGLFGGFQKNLGFNQNILSGKGTFLGRWQNIDHIYRIAPSVKYVTGRLVLGAEIDFNVVAYGTVEYLDMGKVKNAHEVSGVRGLLTASFLF